MEQIYPGKPRWKYEEEEVGGGRPVDLGPHVRAARRARGVALGWIIEKDGKGLVQKRSKLNAHQRQQHLQQWARRLAADKTCCGSTERGPANRRRSRRASGWKRRRWSRRRLAGEAGHGRGCIAATKVDLSEGAGSGYRRLRIRIWRRRARKAAGAR